jgi:hypothetical protein
MNIPATVPVRTASSRVFRRPAAAAVKVLCKRTLSGRFRHFIERTDWDENLYRKVIDRVCLCVIIFSVIYFCFRPGVYLAGMVFQNH